MQPFMSQMNLHYSLFGLTVFVLLLIGFLSDTLVVKYKLEQNGKRGDKIDEWWIAGVTITALFSLFCLGETVNTTRNWLKST